ncbi:MAG: RNA 3'-terminal phosphate cyclase [Candidatus Omnitrophica bacterium]|nr:RNA 3'-terminal phosphate cyclase [Candidatus Omnitrophota bacterium]
MLIIDGDYSEGGGQILRTAVALSIITRQPLKVINIRKRRPKPGLRPQHLAVLKALAEISKATTSGFDIGSQEIEFEPTYFASLDSQLEIDTQTSAAIGLVLQPLLLVAAFATSGLLCRIYGGTSGLGAMPVDYYKDIILPVLRHIGLRVDLEIIRYGFYPKGGGQVSLFVDGIKSSKPLIRETQGKIKNINGLSVASKELADKEVAQRQAKAGEDYLKRSFDCPIKIDSLYVDTESVGSQISLFAHTNKGVRLGADARGEKGKASESVGRDAACLLEEEIASGAAVDRHLADNLIPWLALLGGRLKIARLTSHTKTNIWVCEQFFGKIFRVEENEVSTGGCYAAIKKAKV